MIRSYSVLTLILLITGLSADAAAQYNVTGHWEGAIQVAGIELGIKTDFNKIGDTLAGTIDIPMQNAFRLPLKDVQLTGDKIHFVLPAGPGVAAFDGILTGDTIRGDYMQSGMKGTFYLNRVALDLGIPVDVKTDLYNEEDVLIPNGKDTIGGTLTLPKKGGSFPAVILISGSGAQNRDEEIFGFKPFRIIADHLTNNGLAVLRCDDRGVGKSTGSRDTATGRDFMMDAAVQMNYLKSREEIDARKIGLCGHSEGAMVAVMLAAERKDVAFIVLMAGPAISGDSVILRQIEVLSRQNGVSDEEITGSLIMQSRVYEAVRSDSGWNEIYETLKQKTIAQIERMPEEQRKSISDVNTFAELQVKSTLQMAQSPWFKFFIDYNPARDMEKVKCPVLGLFGELDSQVDPVVNSARVRMALETGNHKDYTVHTFPGTNHLFQKAVVGSPAEYPALAKEFNAGVLDTLSTWLLKRFKIE